jgi:hypothetical protein
MKRTWIAAPKQIVGHSTLSDVVGQMDFMLK